MTCSRDPHPPGWLGLSNRPPPSPPIGGGVGGTGPGVRSRDVTLPRSPLVKARTTRGSQPTVAPEQVVATQRSTPAPPRPAPPRPDSSSSRPEFYFTCFRSTLLLYRLLTQTHTGTERTESVNSYCIK
ncbi:hypothetical protein R5R35_012090 [Gryllus longicercus]|uniref:Uncharacterized protein n=1 Tax=Gryllus longicercus TaxID=2509291 RepID=A0AAN9ZF22_9ORTH